MLVLATSRIGRNFLILTIATLMKMLKIVIFDSNWVSTLLTITTAALVRNWLTVPHAMILYRAGTITRTRPTQAAKIVLTALYSSRRRVVVRNLFMQTPFSKRRLTNSTRLFPRASIIASSNAAICERKDNIIMYSIYLNNTQHHFLKSALITSQTLLPSHTSQLWSSVKISVLAMSARFHMSAKLNWSAADACSAEEDKNAIQNGFKNWYIQ